MFSSTMYEHSGRYFQFLSHFVLFLKHFTDYESPIFLFFGMVLGIKFQSNMIFSFSKRAFCSLNIKKAVQNKIKKSAMDEGMPWGIIMTFFLIGMLLGIRAEVNKRKREAKEAAKLKE